MLNELDKEFERRELPFVRYADDSMIFCKSKRAARRVKESIYVMKGKCRLTVHPKSKAKMKSRLKELTNRSNGWGYVKKKQKLKEYIRGWIGYYHLADMKRFLLDTDKWLRRRMRHVYMKSLALPRPRWQTSLNVV